MRVISIDVHGTPAPQGSKRPRPIYKGRGNAKVFTGKTAMQESSKAVAPWRQDVKHAALEEIAARAATGDDPFVGFTGPVAVTIRFYLSRPKGHWLPINSRRTEPELRVDAPTRPTGTPDLDKLIRSTLDALTSAEVWTDDALVVTVEAHKFYAEPGHRWRHVGAQIDVGGAAAP